MDVDRGEHDGMPAAVTSAPQILTSVKPFDFAALMPTQQTAKFQRQRLVLFDLQGVQIVDALEDERDEQQQRVASHKVLATFPAKDHLREVLLSTFPTRRFHTVIAQAPADETLFSGDRIDVATAALRTNRDWFASYSLRHTDWVAVPRLTAKRATWQKQKKKRQRVVNGVAVQEEYLAWTLALSWSVELSVYQREGNVFVRRAVLQQGDNALQNLALGLADQAADLGINPDSDRGISPWPISSCLQASPLASRHGLVDHEEMAADAVPADGGSPASDATTGHQPTPSETPPPPVVDPSALVEPSAPPPVGDAITDPSPPPVTPSKPETPRTDVVLPPTLLNDVEGLRQTLSSCAGKRQHFGELGAVEYQGSQRRSHYCAGINDAVELGEEAMRAVALCEVRVGAEHLAMGLQKDVAGIDGLGYFAQTFAVPHRRKVVGMGIGRDEGVRRGGFFALRRDGRQVGLGQAIHVGGGGELGDADPSLLLRRSGDTAPGLEAAEVPQIGIFLGLEPMAFYLPKIALVGNHALVGGQLAGGYDFSRWLAWGDSVASRIYFGWGHDLQKTRVFSTELLAELSRVFAGRLSGHAGLGIGLTALNTQNSQLSDVAYARTKRSTTAGREARQSGDVELSGATAGITGQVGLDILFSARWSLRSRVLGRFNFSDLEVAPKNKAWKANLGKAHHVQASLGLNYIF